MYDKVIKSYIPILLDNIKSYYHILPYLKT